MDILSAKYPCTITIIARGAPLLPLVFAGHVGRCKIFVILNNRLLSDQWCKLIWRLMLWVPTNDSYLWPAISLFMALLATIVTGNIWLERWPSSRATTISTAVALEVKLIHILVDQLLNGHSVFLCKWRLVLRLSFSDIQFPPLWIDKITIFTCILLYKGLIGDDLLWWYGIHVTQTKFLDKIRNLLVLLNILNIEYGIRSILKDESDVP